ncbi:MAG: hypothetical protein ACTSUE_06645 [Promethearchaeota archaeon]
MLLQLVPDALQIVLIITLILVFFIFLFYEKFGRQERLEYLAYLAATIPFAYLWVIGMDYLGATFVLLLLWTICLARDLVASIMAKKDKKKDGDFANAVILYAVAVGLYLLYAIIMPNLNLELKTRPGTQNFQNAGFIWLPELDNLNPFINPFRMMVTIDLFMILIPIIAEVKSASVKVPVWANILLSIGMALPTLFLVYIWILDSSIIAVLGFLLGVLYFILFLYLTKGK